METALLATFLVIHGLVHLAVWATTPTADKPPPFDARHSWALTAAHVGVAPARSLATSLAVASSLAYIAAGALVMTGAHASPLATVGAAIGIVLKVAYFNPWLTFGVALDIAVLAAVFAS